MKRIIITSALIVASIGSLAGCSTGYTEGPAPQVKPSSPLTSEQNDLYTESATDDNYLTHWVFDQKLPNGKTVTCIVAREQGHGAIAMDCPELEESAK